MPTDLPNLFDVKRRLSKLKSDIDKAISKKRIDKAIELVTNNEHYSKDSKVLLPKIDIISMLPDDKLKSVEVYDLFIRLAQLTGHEQQEIYFRFYTSNKIGSQPIEWLKKPTQKHLTKRCEPHALYPTANHWVINNCVVSINVTIAAKGNSINILYSSCKLRRPDRGWIPATKVQKNIVIDCLMFLANEIIKTKHPKYIEAVEKSFFSSTISELSRLKSNARKIEQLMSRSINLLSRSPKASGPE